LLSREIPHLRRYAHALAKDPVLADDLVQDCLERALRKWRLWRPNGRVRSWLFRMLYRVYLNQIGKSRRDSETMELAEIREPAAPTAHQSVAVEVGEIAAAIDGLPDDQRAAVLLVALEGMNYDEAAWILDIPVGTLRSRLSRGREALRTATGALEPRAVHLRRVK
jgi:RNA polymerase sigma-70 factor, ECF subfamily